MQNDLKYWLAFSQFSKIGAVRFKKLYTYFDTLEQAWQASAKEFLKAGLEKNLTEELLLKRSTIDPDQELAKIKAENIDAITIKDNLYPQLLKQIYSPPALSYIKGNLENLNSQLSLAVVGTRKISPYGQQITPQLVKGLVANGFTIVSGLALGIDALAHQITLNENGRTIAVLGSGLDQKSIYPGANRYLAEKILKNKGTVISEFPINTLPLKHNFPTRNRIIAGLSLGTLVVEAGQRSGALITAFQSLEQNREVFAVPGQITNPVSAGPNKLIQNGAKMVTSYQDILDELNLHEVTTIVKKNNISVTEFEQIILNQLSQQPLHIDQIIKNTQLSAGQVASNLSFLEMKGLVKNLGSQNYIKI